MKLIHSDSQLNLHVCTNHGAYNVIGFTGYVNWSTGHCYLSAGAEYILLRPLATEKILVNDLTFSLLHQILKSLAIFSKWNWPIGIPLLDWISFTRENSDPFPRFRKRQRLENFSCYKSSSLQWGVGGRTAKTQFPPLWNESTSTVIGSTPTKNGKSNLGPISVIAFWQIWHWPILHPWIIINHIKY